MRRRTRREPNTSEATGKTGREIPTNQPRPLSPSYLADLPVPQRGAEKPRVEEKPRAEERPRNTESSQASGSVRAAEKARPTRMERASDPAPSRRMEVETQPEMPTAAAGSAEASAPSSADPKGYVVLTIGLPGSGKTTWFKRRGVTPLSSDMLRTILFDDITEQRYQGLVFATLRSLLRARLIAKMPWNYVDATNLSAHERRQWIKMAKSFGYEVQGVYFDVPLAVCLERNAMRDRPVSEEAMQRMAEKLKAPDFEEGFSKITVVRVKSA